ncbi:Hypothetical predicted protein [Cloeon dipterum]|uniref:NADH dehydrogenase [ubiquinone] 1 subunit C2 n=1 Tax=Cloeon dipterum TaxID=197152 RepID=A0A8S1DXR0_9INSE|nr:Hypothetical predicted protein [Cloeon dipterum]CAB3387207.1 Hypothetical predicted protein [Cloeon dipterum]
MERKTALELLDPSHHDDVSVLYKNWGIISGSFVGSIGALWYNWANRRPTLSGLPRSLIIVASLAGAGRLLQDYRDKRLAQRDAVLRHYISLHPEDFELPPRVKYSEVFGSWIPVR